MNLIKEFENGALIIKPEGALDTAAAPQTEKELKADVKRADGVTLDLRNVPYVSSAGLRLILNLHKALKKKGGLTVRNANGSVREVFELTGFSDLLRIE